MSDIDNLIDRLLRYGEYGLSEKTVDEIFEILEKQIPKKPKELDTQDGLNCPACYTAINNNNRYCPKCGQRIDCLMDKVKIADLSKDNF